MATLKKIKEIVMKLLFVATAVCLMMGCSNASTIEKPKKEVAKMSYGVNLDEYKDIIIDFNLEQEYQYVAAETYGPVAFHAIGACFKKYEHMLDNIDTSTDYGSSLLTKFSVDNEKCVSETLSIYTPLDEDVRETIPRENIEMELASDEVDEFDDLSLDVGESLPVAPYDKASPRYIEMRKVCEETNSSVPKDEFESSVEFCVSKSM